MFELGDYFDFLNSCLTRCFLDSIIDSNRNEYHLYLDFNHNYYDLLVRNREINNKKVKYNVYKIKKGLK